MYNKCGSVEEAEDVFAAMSQKDPISWTTMLAAYIERGRGENAFGLYKQMQAQGATHDEVTVACMLQACSEMGNLEMCRHQHFIIVASGEEPNPTLCASLIDAYGSGASVIDAEASFDALREPCISSCNACIGSRAAQGDCTASLRKFDELQLTGAEADEVTLISILGACSHGGLAVEALECFTYMIKMGRFCADLKHFGIMVDLFGRAGDFGRAEGILEKILMEVDHAIWLCLLGACRIHGNVEVAERAFARALLVQPKQPAAAAAAYVLMSNIYAQNLENLRFLHGTST
jgi:pentatricopeptide repeat protein